MIALGLVVEDIYGYGMVPDWVIPLVHCEVEIRRERK